MLTFIEYLIKVTLGVTRNANILKVQTSLPIIPIIPIISISWRSSFFLLKFEFRSREISTKNRNPRNCVCRNVASCNPRLRTPAFYSPSRLSHLVNRTKLEEQGWGPAGGGERQKRKEVVDPLDFLPSHRHESETRVAALEGGSKVSNRTEEETETARHDREQFVIAVTTLNGSTHSWFPMPNKMETIRSPLLCCFLLLLRSLTFSYVFDQIWLCAAIDSTVEPINIRMY